MRRFARWLMLSPGAASVLIDAVVVLVVVCIGLVLAGVIAGETP